MCLALLKRAGSHITRKQLTTAWQINSDGAGFMYVKDGNLFINKGFFNFKRFYQSLRCAESDAPESPFVIHLRLATSGKTDINNCHPFSVNNNLAFVHNGIFKKFSNGIKFSDTQLFNKVILQKLPENFLGISAYITLLKSYCRDDISKLIFLDSKKNYTILGEEKGEWKNGVWFSTPPITIYSVKNTSIVPFEKTYEPVKPCFICKGYYEVRELVVAPRLNALVCPSCLQISKRWVKYDEIVCPVCNELIEVPDDWICPVCEARLDSKDIKLLSKNEIAPQRGYL